MPTQRLQMINEEKETRCNKREAKEKKRKQVTTQKLRRGLLKEQIEPRKDGWLREVSQNSVAA